MVEGLPSIGETLAKNLLAGFGSVRAVFNATEDDLKRVPKIGEVKASEIVRLVTAAYEGEQKHLDADASDDDEA